MKFKKFIKNLPDMVAEELDAADESGLKTAIATATQNIETATTERDNNTEYQNAKQAVNDLSQGLKSAKQYQGAKINYALLRLKELKGDLIEVEQLDLDEHRSRMKGRRPSKKDQEDALPPVSKTNALVKDIAQSMANVGLPGVTVSLNGKSIPKTS